MRSEQSNPNARPHRKH